jgi:3-hydroxyisobutyrate dehydrogenase
MNEDRAAPAFDAGLKIGFIGLGNMGAPMVRCLIEAGVDVVVQDISTAATASLSEVAVQIVATPAAVAAQADIIFMSLPTPDIVTAVCTGPNGILAGGNPKIVVDLSTTGPRATSRLAEIFRARGISLIDAPVSGGVGAAEQGSLAIMGAGNPAAYGIVEPFLNILGSKVFFIGERPGMGQSMKLVNNMMAATNAIAAFETLALGAKLGLDAQLMLDVLNVSSGQNFATSVKIPQCVMPRTFPTRFATNLMHKDVRLCVEEAEACGALLWVGQTVKQILAFAIAQGDGDKDYATIIQHFERWAGATVGSASVK